MSKQMLVNQKMTALPLGDATASALKLSPYLSSEVQAFLNDKHLVFDLVNGLGSPLNVLFPDLVGNNVLAFQEVFNKFQLPGKIYFAHKANRSDSIVKKLSMANVCIDVASVAELKHALGCGFAADRIEATGPKNIEFLALSLAHNIVINVDSLAELEQLAKLKEKQERTNKTPILLRLSDCTGHQTQHGNKSSRFGICESEFGIAFEILAKSISTLNLVGFAFHLDTISVTEKSLAIEQCLELFEHAFVLGFEPYVLNIGGGFKLNYLAQQSDWDNYTTALREAVMGIRAPITWQRNSFGLKEDKNALRGNFNSYNYYDPLTGPKFLEELLQQTLPNHNDMQIAQFLSANGIQVWIEPGRSLLDQVGLTIGTVTSTRKSSRHENLVCLEMKRQDLCFLDQEFFVDPIILYRTEDPTNSGEQIPVYFAGNLCLESDLIYRHQTFVKQMPIAGDLIVFPNTAGYFMDFSASEAIMQPIAAKVAVYREGERYAWSCDHKYQPQS